MPYRCDFYSDEEYQQACVLEEEQYKEQFALEEYQQECAYQEYLMDAVTDTNVAKMDGKGEGE